MENSPTERTMRPIVLDRKNYFFIGSASGGTAAAIVYTLVKTAGFDSVDLQVWLVQVLERIPDCKITCIDEPLPWNCA